jgi:uncharacterized protein
MLRSFRLANHRSFRDEHELLLMPTYDKTGRTTVPVAAIYGANASGKSNLLDALGFMAYAVRDSSARWKPAGGVPRRPFRLDATSAQQPSVFVVELVLDSVRHVYGFAVDDERVLEEWLYVYPHSRKRVIFERAEGSVTFGSTITEQRARKTELLAQLTRPNALFLSLGAQLGQAEMTPAYTWFTEQLQFGGSAPASLQLVSNVIGFVVGNESRQRMLVDLLRAADLGLSDVRVREQLVPDRTGLRRPELTSGGPLVGLMPPELIFVHGPGESELTLWDESDGTVSWLGLLLPVLKALESGGTVVVDEIDASLHPELAARLILMFQDDRTNPRDAQLLFTTHDATLLGTAFGEEVLERDQIWFVEKDETGASRLYPLSDFHPRQGENRERRYLGGSYGAVPILSDPAFAKAVRPIGEGVGGRAS